MTFTDKAAGELRSRLKTLGVEGVRTGETRAYAEEVLALVEGG